MSIRRFPDGYPLDRSSRWLLAVWLLFLIGGFSLARWLVPNSNGFGTHQQLGLPPCSFHFLTGLPCPSCGMTTSFAYFTRGNLAQSFGANPAGLLLALVCAVQIPWGFASLWKRRLVLIDRPAETMVTVAVTLMIVCMINWTTVIIRHKMKPRTSKSPDTLQTRISEYGNGLPGRHNLDSAAGRLAAKAALPGLAAPNLVAAAGGPADPAVFRMSDHHWNAVDVGGTPHGRLRFQDQNQR